VVDVAAPSPRLFLAATSSGLLRSADGGATWQRLTLGSAMSVCALVASKARAGVVLAATPLGLYRSEDSGATWGLVSAAIADAEIHSLALLPGDEQVVFATTPRGLLRSPDEGHTWYWRGGGLPLSDITGLALHPGGRTLYASDFGSGGLYQSDDAGLSWRRLPSDGLVTDHVWAVALDPARPERLLAISAAGGLHALVPPAETAAAGGAQAPTAQGTAPR
jgi:photosystem II stability/assembly factor-like uncharacterized protein